MLLMVYFRSLTFYLKFIDKILDKAIQKKNENWILALNFNFLIFTFFVELWYFKLYILLDQALKVKNIYQLFAPSGDYRI